MLKTKPTLKAFLEVNQTGEGNGIGKGLTSRKEQTGDKEVEEDLPVTNPGWLQSHYSLQSHCHSAFLNNEKKIKMNMLQ